MALGTIRELYIPAKAENEGFGKEPGEISSQDTIENPEVSFLAQGFHYPSEVLPLCPDYLYTFFSADLFETLKGFFHTGFGLLPVPLVQIHQTVFVIYRSRVKRSVQF